MKRIFLKPILAIIALCSVHHAYSQELMWDAGFDFFFDNREYKSDINWSQTIFGARLAPEVGIRWEGRHSLMLGVNLLANFGARPFSTGNEGIMYYQYDSEKFDAFAGVVPRKKLIGEYSPAFFSDSIYYHDPNLTGLIVQLTGRRGYFEFAADWNSMISDETREKFILFSAARLNLGRFYAGYNLSMYHHANVYNTIGVVDNILAYPFVGIDLADLTRTEAFDFRAGWLKAFQRDRDYLNEFLTPGGVQLQLKVQKWKLGIDNTLYVGKDLMPYWFAPEEGDEYGTGLYWGEPFYRTKNVYNRAEFYWEPLNNEHLTLRISSVHHYDGHILNWQQKVLFSFKIGQRRVIPK